MGWGNNGKKTCADCALCKFTDVGYSNWTVEGTNFECLAKIHPNGDFDRWYGEDWRLLYANWCPAFREGRSLHLSVEGDIL